MVGLGIGVFFFGYWTLAYGWSQLRGQNAGFFQIVWPGAYANNLAPADSGSSSVKTPAPTTPSTGSQTPGKNPIQVLPGGGIRDYNPNQLSPQQSI